MGPPENAVRSGKPTEAMVVNVLVSKFLDDLSFYRQGKIYERGRALILIVRHSPSESVAPPGICGRCMSACWRSSRSSNRDCMPQ